MTIKQLAERLGIGYGNARALMLSKGFPMFRVGRQPIVDPDDFEMWRMKHIGCSVPTSDKPKEVCHKQNRRGNYPIGSVDFSKLDYFKGVM